MRTRSLLFFVAVGALVVVGCDASAEPCTEIGCEPRAVISFPTSVNAPYDLSLDIEGAQSVRCNDPGSLEEQENPDFVTCDSGGFELRGNAAERSSLTVVVTDPAAQEVVFPNQLVTLATSPDVPPETPNGPGCPPECYTRFGEIEPLTP